MRYTWGARLFIAGVFVTLFSLLGVLSYAVAADTTIETTTTTTNTSTSTNTNTSTSTMDYKNQPVQRASAPNVTVSNNDVCVAGVSGGAQGNAIGISFGTTVTDLSLIHI